MALEVSVALCTRNGARYLPDQVRSICAQEPLPREIVLSDDGSSDDTLAVVRDTLAQCGVADRIALRVFSNSPPLGVTRNFEQAVRACSHDLIALCDQDDVWHPGRLARMVAQFEARPDLLLLHTDARLVDGDLKPLGSTLFHALEVQPAELEAIASGEAFGVLLRRNLVTGATTMFRKTLLDAALPFAPEWVHDEWLAAVAAATGRVDVLPEPTIDYRQHGNNQIGARRLTLSEKVAKAFVARGDKHVARLRRAEALLQRLEQLGGRVRAGCLDAQRDKAAHQRFRAGLPAARPLRLLPILLEAARGRYERFGRGKQAIVQDVFERG
ncbi:glycosyltransferase family 2 protein [Variovorax sp. W6]|uniref:glycosyltransferase family 2 protein n=1 Tax=Variovorax sp. W6 TaxID=3093895 RepID=UPI003D807FEE